MRNNQFPSALLLKIKENEMGNFNIYNKMIMIPAILFAFAFHEFAHALCADRLGDKTPRYEGRLTLDPMKHIDIVGFIMIILVGFGWAKPVNTNPSAYKNYYRDDFLVNIAGPIANFVLSIIATFVLAIYSVTLYNYIPIDAANVLYDMIQSVVTLNVMLGFFNLLPVPGFDGYHILQDIFKDKFYKFENAIGNYRILIMLAAVYFAGYIILPPSRIVIGYLNTLCYYIMMLF